MITDKVDEKRVRLRNLLLNLAKSQEILSSRKEKQNIFRELEDLYYAKTGEEEFRHFYSDIFAVLSQIDRDPAQGNLDVLTQNMELIRKGYRAVNKGNDGRVCDVSKQINKLYDHVNLDVARINYSKVIELRSQGELQKLDYSLSKMEESIHTVKDSVDQAGDLQKQYVTILGIFASIVLAFTGGIAFSTSVLENIAAAGIYRILIIVVGLSFTLTNVIYILTRFIQEINKGNGEVIKYPKYMKVLNWVFGIAIFLIIICWVFDVEHIAQIIQNLIY